MSHHRNKHADGSNLMATIFRYSMYTHNPACLSEKRQEQVKRRMYRCYWVEYYAE